MSDPRCPACQASITPTWNFCRQCGAERDERWPTLEVATLEETAEGAARDEQGLPGDPEISWGVGGALLVFSTSLMVTLVVAVTLATAYGEEPTSRQTDQMTAITLLANQLSLAGAAIFWVRYLKGSMRAFGFRPLTARAVKIGLGVGGIGLVLSALTATVIAWVVEAVSGTAPAEPEQIALETSPGGLLLLLLAISTIVMAPLAEEIFFRGMLHQAIRRKVAFVPGVLLSSVVFGLVHVIPIVIPSIFVLAILLAVSYERERTIWVPIIAHATFNLVGYTFTFLL